MNGFKHGVFVADVCTARSAYAALKLCRLVGYNVAVKVRQNKYLKVCAALFVNKLCCGYVNIPLVGCDFGIVLCNVFAKVKELAVGGFDDVCFCYYRNSVFFVVSCVFICKLCYALCTLGCGNNKVKRKDPLLSCWRVWFPLAV